MLSSSKSWSIAINQGLVDRPLLVDALTTTSGRKRTWSPLTRGRKDSNNLALNLQDCSGNI